MDQYLPGSQPDPNAGVWPPAPTGQPGGQYPAPQPMIGIPFKFALRRAPGKAAAKAKISDIREGFLQFDPQGIIIQGKAIPRAEIRALVLIPCFLISLLIAVIANSLMEYAFRHDEYLGVRWTDVREVTLAPEKQQACLVYDAPNYAGKVMTFSLAFTPVAGAYEALAQSLRAYAPVSVTEGKLRSATSPILIAFLVVFLLTIFGLAIWASSGHH